MLSSIAAFVRRSVPTLLIGLAVGACASPVATVTPSPEPTPSATAPPTVEPTPRPPLTAGLFPESLVGGLVTEVDVPYTEPLPCGAGECEVPLDVLAPEGAEDVPTIVLFPGGPGAFNDRRYLDVMSSALAQQGAVVFLPSYRSTATSNTIDDSVEDVRCAIRYARSRTSQYGGDPDRLVLVGHSYGSSLALEVGANPEAPAPGCLAEGDGVPNAVVALAGFVFDVTDPVDAAIPFVLMSGSEDGARAGGEPAAEQLRGAGFEAEYVELPDIDHFEIVDPAAVPEVAERIFAAVEPPAD
jgi:acetyl esterase/lipase